MYDLAKKARAGMKSKAQRLAGEKDQKTDSSDWSPAEPLNADVKTGMRPVSRRAYKDGGKVADCAPMKRADRKARKAGGRVEEKKGEQPLVDRYINRDLKKANDYRDGKKHIGALKDGGRAAKANGGSMTMEEMLKKYPAPKKSEEFKAPNPVPLPPRRQEEKPKFKSKYDLNTQSYKKGGAAKHDDIKQDKALIKKMIKASEAKEGRAKKMDGGPMMGDPRLNIVKNKALEFGNNLVTPGLKSGGRAKKADGGSIRERFNAEFAKQRAAGAKKFTFEGTEYGTDLYKPTTGPSKRGRGKTSSPDMKPSFGTPPLAADRVSKSPKSEPKPAMSMSSGQPITEAQRRGKKWSDVLNVNTKEGHASGAFNSAMGEAQKEADASGQFKKGGRIAKQIGGALGKAAGALSRGMPSAQAPTVGLPVMGGGPRPVGGMGMSRPTPMGGKQQFGGQTTPATPMPFGGGKNPTPFNPGPTASFEPWLGGQPSPGGMGGYPMPMRPPGAEQPMPMGPGFPGGPPIGGGRLAPPNQGLPDGQSSMMPNPFYPVPQVGGGSTTYQLAQQEGFDPRKIASTEGLSADQLAKIRGSQQFGQQSPGNYLIGSQPSQAPFDPYNNRVFQPSGGSGMMTGIPAGEYGPDAFRPVNLGQPMPRKNGGRVARAFGGPTINEGHSKPKGKSGKTNINIIIAAGSKKEPESMVPTVPPAPMGMPPMPAPAAPTAAPMGGGMPPSAPMLGGAPSPMGGPEMPPMPMPRKDGGRITKVAKSYKDMEAGAASGEGRLQKTDIAKRIPKPAFEKGLNLSDARGYPNKVPGATGGRTARNDGGKVYRSYRDMDAGAGSGKGRLEKTQIQSRKK